jgi:hypothetical protein
MNIKVINSNDERLAKIETVKVVMMKEQLDKNLFILNPEYM